LQHSNYIVLELLLPTQSEGNAIFLFIYFIYLFIFMQDN